MVIKSGECVRASVRACALLKDLARKQKKRECFCLLFTHTSHGNFVQTFERTVFMGRPLYNTQHFVICFSKAHRLKRIQDCRETSPFTAKHRVTSDINKGLYMQP